MEDETQLLRPSSTIALGEFHGNPSLIGQVPQQRGSVLTLSAAPEVPRRGSIHVGGS